MNATTALSRATPRALSRSRNHLSSPFFVLTVLILASATAHAVDGCQVLLCLAAPQWRAIPQCVPPITQVLRDLARGKPLPACDMAGPGSSASHAWSSAPDFCPPQYIHSYSSEHALVHTCDYAGVVSVVIDNVPFARTWWAPDGDTVTEFSAAAKAQLGSWDTRFESDYAAWQNTQRPSVAPTAARSEPSH